MSQHRVVDAFERGYALAEIVAACRFKTAALTHGLQHLWIGEKLVGASREILWISGLEKPADALGEIGGGVIR